MIHGGKIFFVWTPSETFVFRNHQTGYYGYRHRLQGRGTFHYTLDTCLTLEDALSSCDPHNERIWEEASDADEETILTSSVWKEGSVGWRMDRIELAARGKR